MAIDVVAESLAQLRDFVWPPRCLGCDRRIARGDGIVCESCSPLLRRISGPTCPTCALPRSFAESDAQAPCRSCRRHSPPQEAGFAYWLYEGAVSQAIQRAKYAGDVWRLQALAEAMQPWFQELLGDLRSEIGDAPVRMTAVPMHTAQLRERGFNAAIQLARTASAGAPPWLQCEWEILEQPVRTRPQAGLTRGERRRNVRDAFSVRDSDALADAVWLLFDDVSTTGATLAEAAGELAEAGARAVYTVAAARTPRETHLAARR